MKISTKDFNNVHINLDFTVVTMWTVRNIQMETRGVACKLTFEFRNSIKFPHSMNHLNLLKRATYSDRITFSFTLTTLAQLSKRNLYQVPH